MQKSAQYILQHQADFVDAKHRLIIATDHLNRPIIQSSTSNNILDKMIKFYANKLFFRQDGTRNKKHILIDGIITINVRYSPNQNQYDFVLGIISKLVLCSGHRDMQVDLTDETAIEILKALIDNQPLEQILDKFSENDLDIYGW
jgi:hypothetical protein